MLNANPSGKTPKEKLPEGETGQSRDLAARKLIEVETLRAKERQAATQLKGKDKAGNPIGVGSTSQTEDKEPIRARDLAARKLIEVETERARERQKEHGGTAPGKTLEEKLPQVLGSRAPQARDLATTQLKGNREGKGTDAESKPVRKDPPGQNFPGGR